MTKVGNKGTRQQSGNMATLGNVGGTGEAENRPNWKMMTAFSNTGVEELENDRSRQ